MVRITQVNGLLTENNVHLLYSQTFLRLEMTSFDYIICTSVVKKLQI